MFYRKYRPQTFTEVSKPNEPAVALANQVVSKSIAHAYLFIGPRGTGKTTTARIFAKALNCKKLSKSGDPCDECEACVAIREGKHIDLIEIDAASNRGIEDIRLLKESVGLSSFSSKYKIYIIDEVHMLTLEAFNALLKTLEEPPKHVVFILCTTESHKVPETIKSRCQVFKFKKPTVKQIVSRLEEICKQEKKELSKEDLVKIAVAAYGGFRDADTLLEQVLEKSITIESLLGSNTLETYIKLTKAIIDQRTQEGLSLINKLYDDGTDLVNWTNEYIRYLRDLLYIQAGYSKGVSDVPEDIYAKMEAQAFKLDSSDVVELIERFIKAVNEIKTTAIHQLPLELAVIEAGLYRSTSDNKNSDGSRNITEDGKSSPEESTAEKNSKLAYDDGLEGLDEQEPSSKRKQKSEDEELDNLSSIVSLESINDAWNDLLKEVKPFNHSVEAVLKSCKPFSVKDGELTLEVAYAFHKERLESKKSREIFEKVLQNKFGTKIRVKCVLKSKAGESLTDKNIEPVVDEHVKKVTKDAMDVFDGKIEL